MQTLAAGLGSLGGNGVFGSEADELAVLLAPVAPKRHDVAGNHHGKPEARGEPGGQMLAGEIVRDVLSRHGLTGTDQTGIGP